MAGGFWIYGGVLIAVAVVLIILFAIGLSRAANVRRRAGEVGRTDVPRDPTESKEAAPVADSGATGGNYSRSVPYKQDVGTGASVMGTGKADDMTRSDRQ